MGEMRYVTKLLDALKTNTVIITTDPDSWGLISIILKKALPAYPIYAVQERHNNEENPFLTFQSNEFMNLSL